MSAATEASAGAGSARAVPSLPDGRRTIARAVTLRGVGLHLGAECELTFRPGAPGAGVRFVRVDRPGRPEVPALVAHAVESERRTVIGDGENALHTVEHVLAAVTALGIDDLRIEVDAAEPPILDGSAAPFFDALVDAGVCAAPGAVEWLDLPETVRVIDGASVYEAFPAPSLSLEVTIDFAHHLIGRQAGRYAVTAEAFARELAPARTFGFVREVEALRAKGLIRGASTANAVVLDERGVVDAALRWPDEFVRHKAMDVIGDLALAGRRVRARVVALRPSHRGTVTLVRAMLQAAASPSTVVAAPARRPAAPSAAPTLSRPTVLGIEEIMKVLPHRYPFLLVDRIVEMAAPDRVVGVKNVTMNEPFFQGHFPGHPVMPGVLIVEAMAQTGGMLLLGGLPDPSEKVVYFMSLDNVKFRQPVRPGDQLRLELDALQVRGKVCKMRGVAKVDGKVVCEAEMSAMIRDR